MERKDRHIMEQLNMLRGLFGVEIFHKSNLMKRLDIRDNIFAELVKHGLILKVRKGRYFEYHLPRERVAEQDVAKALDRLRNKHVKHYRENKGNKFTAEEAIAFLKERGYVIYKPCLYFSHKLTNKSFWNSA